MNFIFKGANTDEEIALTERQIAQFEKQVIVLKGYILYLRELEKEANASQTGELTNENADS